MHRAESRVAVGTTYSGIPEAPVVDPLTQGRSHVDRGARPDQPDDRGHLAAGRAAETDPSPVYAFAVAPNLRRQPIIVIHQTHPWPFHPQNRSRPAIRWCAVPSARCLLPLWHTAEALRQRALAISGSVRCNYLDECVVSQVMGLVLRSQLLQLTHQAVAGFRTASAGRRGCPPQTHLRWPPRSGRRWRLQPALPISRS